MTVKLAVIDNNASMCSFIAEISTELGFETRVFASGDAFLGGDIKEPDIILLAVDGTSSGASLRQQSSS